MGCGLSKQGGAARSGQYALAKEDLQGSKLHKLQAPQDDVVTDISSLGAQTFAASGSDGWVHIYGGPSDPGLRGQFRAHAKTVNRLLPFGDRLFTACGDGSVSVWATPQPLSPVAGDLPAEPLLKLAGHGMSVRALDAFSSTADPSSASRLMTGSRDCSVCLWDVARGEQLQRSKILRNVVTAIRALPGTANVAVQASEDLILRLWDVRVGLTKPAAEVAGGPNQLVCLDLCEDGNKLLAGTKGFSRENCQVKAFDVRASLKECASVPLADQTIEVLRCGLGSERCLAASKDGCLRVLSTRDLSILAERGPNANGGYTALGLQRHEPTDAAFALAAVAGAQGPELELLRWKGASLEVEPELVASTS